MTMRSSSKTNIVGNRLSGFVFHLYSKTNKKVKVTLLKDESLMEGETILQYHLLFQCKIPVQIRALPIGLRLNTIKILIDIFETIRGSRKST